MKAQKVIEYYVLCNKLKNVIRTGWKIWNVKKDRVESVAEHIYGTQMLAIAMASEYEYDIDLKKVILMLAVHELEEIIIGDIPMSSEEHKNKAEIGHLAIKEVLKNLRIKEEIESLILEFDAMETKEALFAYHCDKLECDLQAKLYDEEGFIDLKRQEGNKQFELERVKTLLQEGVTTFSEIWFHGDKRLFTCDDNFMEVFEYVRHNEIKKNFDN